VEHLFALVYNINKLVKKLRHTTCHKDGRRLYATILNSNGKDNPLMSKIFSRINHYFIASEEEHIPVSDFITFYGIMLGIPTYTLAILLAA